jgi:hypothetical protein
VIAVVPRHCTQQYVLLLARSHDLSHDVSFSITVIYFFLCRATSLEYLFTSIRDRASPSQVQHPNSSVSSCASRRYMVVTLQCQTRSQAPSNQIHGTPDTYSSLGTSPLTSPGHRRLSRGSLPHIKRLALSVTQVKRLFEYSHPALTNALNHTSTVSPGQETTLGQFR